MILLYHKDIMAVSHEGDQYYADGNGLIEVPEDVVCELIAKFGFSVAADETGAEPSAAKPTKPIATWSNAELVQKATELGIKAEGVNRNDLLKAVLANLKVTVSDQWQGATNFME
ncbi:MAG: hypothetical protein FWG12_07610 [Holophagaceae bacterium]|jgi:hypothetical protein|nr:hypothetical protein [Holophagaceae bacterium]